MTAKTCETCGHGGAERFGGFCGCALLPKYRSVPMGKGCCFTPDRWAPVDANVLAKRAAQAGIDQAASAADRASEGWTDRAYGFIERYAKRVGRKQFIGHDIVEASKAAGFEQPENPRAWGSPIQKAVRTGVLVKKGTTEDTNDRRHASPVPLYESGLQMEQAA